MTDPPDPREWAITTPEPLRSDHAVDAFHCGKPPLDDWLKTRASRNEGRGSRTYVVCHGGSVVAYYCLASAGVQRASFPGSLSRNMPEPVPMMVLGRLAVHARFQGRGLGEDLLKDAMRRAAQANRIAGFRALLVHALDDEACAFYAKFGFQEFPPGTRTLFLPVETFVAAL